MGCEALNTTEGKLREKTSQTAASGGKAYRITDSGLSEGILLAVCDLKGGPPKTFGKLPRSNRRQAAGTPASSRGI